MSERKENGWDGNEWMGWMDRKAGVRDSEHPDVNPES